MSLRSARCRFFEAVQSGDLNYVKSTINTMSRLQINRALRIACSYHQPEMATVLIEQGADDFEGGLIVACRVNDLMMVEFMLNYIVPKPSVEIIHMAFNVACEHDSLDAARKMMSFDEIIWDYSVLSNENACRLLKTYFLSGLYGRILINDYWAAKVLELLQPEEYYNINTLQIRIHFPEMAETVIAHRLDRYYRFKWHLDVHVPICDLVLLCCSYL